LDAGTQLISSSTFTHIAIIFVLLGLISYNYYTVQTQKHFMLMAKRLKQLTPVYHSLNFAMAYTGAVLAGFTHDLSPTVILMIPVTLFLMITEIKRYKKMRVIKHDKIDVQNEFRKFAKKIYTMQVIAIAFMYIIANIF
jgi:cytochrome c biogenesis protein CcdA